MIGRTRDRRVGLNPHLLTNGLIPSLLVHLSWVNSFLIRNKSGSLIVVITIFFVTFIKSGRNQSSGNERGINRLRKWSITLNEHGLAWSMGWGWLLCAHHAKGDRVLAVRRWRSPRGSVWVRFPSLWSFGDSPLHLLLSRHAWIADRGGVFPHSIATLSEKWPIGHGVAWTAQMKSSTEKPF
jgi:hypothetical protein